MLLGMLSSRMFSEIFTVNSQVNTIYIFSDGCSTKTKYYIKGFHRSPNNSTLIVDFTDVFYEISNRTGDSNLKHRIIINFLIV